MVMIEMVLVRTSITQACRKACAISSISKTALELELRSEPIPNWARSDRSDHSRATAAHFDIWLQPLSLHVAYMHVLPQDIFLFKV